MAMVSVVMSVPSNRRALFIEPKDRPNPGEPSSPDGGDSPMTPRRRACPASRLSSPDGGWAGGKIIHATGVGSREQRHVALAHSLVLPSIHGQRRCQKEKACHRRHHADCPRRCVECQRDESSKGAGQASVDKDDKGATATQWCRLTGRTQEVVVRLPEAAVVILIRGHQVSLDRRIKLNAGSSQSV